MVDPLALARPRLAAEVGRALEPTTSTATGGRNPYMWELGGAPAWIRLDPLPALLNGTPPAAGRFPLQISVKDAYGTTATLGLVIIVSAKLAIKTAKLPATTVGKLYSATLRTAGGVPPFSWKATSGKFPAGIKLKRELGVLKRQTRQTRRLPAHVQSHRLTRSYICSLTGLDRESVAQTKMTRERQNDVS